MDRKLKIFLDQAGVSYQRIPHGQTFTALETAASAHVAAKELAKSVLVRVDGDLVMAVLPATHSVDLSALRALTHAEVVRLAEEREFEHLFPDCEPGAMPPFGNLYGIPVYVSTALAEDLEIAFNAGSHDELVRLAYADYLRLVNPRVCPISEPRLAEI